jgi:hypothetical protein
MTGFRQTKNTTDVLTAIKQQAFNSMIVNALQLSYELADFIREGYSQNSFHGDEGGWTNESRTEAISGYFWRLD